MKDTWDLVELKLGAYVRASLLLIAFVGTVLSFAFWAIGLPYWLLLGILAGLARDHPGRRAAARRRRRRSASRSRSRSRRRS